MSAEFRVGCSEFLMQLNEREGLDQPAPVPTRSSGRQLWSLPHSPRNQVRHRNPVERRLQRIHRQEQSVLSPNEMLERWQKGMMGDPLSLERSNEIVDQIQKKFEGTSLLEYACLVCDELHIQSEGILLSVKSLLEANQRFLPSLQLHLVAVTVAPPLHASHVQLYNVVPTCRRMGWNIQEAKSFEGLLLSPRAVLPRHVRVCNTCKRSIEDQRLPKFAIANHNVVGWLPPELKDVTNMEVKLCSMIVPKITVRFLYGGQQSTNSHGQFF